MENLKKYLTNKNMLVAQIVSGVITLLIAFMIFSVVGTAEEAAANFDLSGITSVVGTIKNACMFFNLLFLLLIVLVGAHVYKVVSMQEKTNENIGLLVLNSISLLIAVFSMGTVSEISKIASSFSQGAESFLGSLFGMSEDSLTSILNVVNLKTPAICFVILQALAVALAYVVFKNKSILNEDNALEIKDTASKTASDLKNTASDVKGKINAYMQTEKGKKNVMIGGVVTAVVVVGAVGISMKRTPIDLVSACEVSFNGYDGFGEATFTCDSISESEDVRIQDFINSVHYSLSEYSNLSNGDKVQLMADYSEEDAEELKIKITSNTKTVEVKNLLKPYKSWDEIDKNNQKFIINSSAEQLDKYITGQSLESSYYGSIYETNELTPIAAFYKFDESYSQNGDLVVLYKASYTSTSNRSGESSDEVEYFTVECKGIGPSENGKGLSETCKDWENSMYVRSVYGNDEEDALDSIRYMVEGYSEVKLDK